MDAIYTEDGSPIKNYFAGAVADKTDALSEDVVAFKSDTEAKFADVDSKVVDLGISDDAIRSNVSLVSDRVEANETATTYNTRDISALKDARALDLSGLTSTFAACLRYAFAGNALIESMKPDEEFLDRG